MRKALSLTLALTLCISMMVVPVYAVTDDEPTVPYYINAASANVNLVIDDSGLATIKSTCRGISGTTSIHATTYLEKKVNGTWSRVDIPEANDQWINSTSSRIFSTTNTHQLTATGNYRAVTVFVVTAGSAETITVTSEATY